jgi:hypothetical protein
VLDSFTDWKRGIWQESMLVMRKPVWGDAGRDAFRTTVWHHHALIDPATPQPQPSSSGAGAGSMQAPAPAPSVLRDVPAGRLAPVLEDLRVRAVAEQAARNAPSFMLRVLRRLRHA